MIWRYPHNHTRQSMRLDGYDYSKPGKYFITIVTKNRKPLLGKIKNNMMKLNELGQIINQSWEWLGNQYDYVVLDEFIIMPNHLHGIIELRGDRCVSRNTSTPISVKRKSLGRLIGALKTVSTKQINQLQNTPGSKIWQRDFYDQIIRGAEDLNRIRQYIRNNPLEWDQDAG